MEALVLFVLGFLAFCIICGTIVGIFNTIRYAIMKKFVNKWEQEKNNGK